ncbi:hypothetical protein FLAG1_03798 [Fusarium langsethiae]|uniref:Uncharacterized protein n=1 Tax=Fusarium langsethiae TaxID=179993 RepID=A0A0M9F078_FUSLA|nr:hypothetical protein FLAG1_03798 [Fusarium langsethiae]
MLVRRGDAIKEHPLLATARERGCDDVTSPANLLKTRKRFRVPHDANDATKRGAEVSRPGCTNTSWDATLTRVQSPMSRRGLIQSQLTVNTRIEWSIRNDSAMSKSASCLETQGNGKDGIQHGFIRLSETEGTIYIFSHSTILSSLKMSHHNTSFCIYSTQLKSYDPVHDHSLQNGHVGGLPRGHCLSWRLMHHAGIGTIHNLFSLRHIDI